MRQLTAQQGWLFTKFDLSNGQIYFRRRAMVRVLAFECDNSSSYPADVEIV